MNLEETEKLVTVKTNILPILTKISSSFKLVIPEEVERKIRHICNKIHDVEWSGALFYTYSGNWEDNTLEITCKDIYVMDIGSAGYTEFDVNPSIVSYMCEADLTDCQIGLIHSHNNMSTFFSNTDTSTLREEGNKRNHFVSLIVNNAGTYTAGITRKVVSQRIVKDSYTYKTFNDEEVVGIKEEPQEVTTIEWCNLQIIKPKGYNFQEIDDRLSEIKKSKASIKPFVPNYNLPRSNQYVAAKFAHNDIKKEYCIQQSLFHEDEEFQIPTISEKLIKSLLLQLLTGSIALSNESKIDIKKWVENMDKIFGKRFEGNMKHYKEWAETMCEFLVYYPTSEYKILDDRDYAMLVSSALIEELAKLPKNKYIEALIEILELWTM